ncbi:unnamed protein product [Cunninghamella echinulata]
MSNNKNSNNLWHRFLDKYHQHHGQSNITVTTTTTSESDTSSLNSKQEKELNTFTGMVYDTFGNKDWKQQQLIKCLKEAQWDSQQAILDMKDIQDAFYGLLSIPPIANSSLNLLGSENDQGTSCYLDALLFAMYIGFTCFDPMLIGDPFEPCFSLPASPIDHNNHHSSSSSSSSSFQHKHDNRHHFFKKYRKNQHHHHKHHYRKPTSTTLLNDISSPTTSRRHRFFTTFKKPSVEKEKQQQLEHELTLALPLKDIDTEEDFKPQQQDITIDNELSDIEKKHHLQRTLRLFVNKLRKGRLVKSRTVYQVRLALTENGWYGPDQYSNTYQQEDVTELFLFLTSIFELPYLPFQLRLFHGANKDVDDDRIMTDRVLLLCLPSTTDQQQQQQQLNDNTIKLETILVDHFYNSVVTGVKRHVDMDNNEETTNSTDSLLDNLDQNVTLKKIDQDTTKHTYNDDDNNDDDDDDSDGESIDKIEIVLKEYKKNVKDSNDTEKFTTSPGPPLKDCSNSNDSKSSSNNNNNSGNLILSPPRLITEVQAWQAMELLPFYSSSNEQGDMINYDQNAFPDTHLILPIVLKRYHINNGLYVKDQRTVQVPDTIPFHQFVNQNMESVICSQCHDSMDYSMSLKSVVCHYGSSPLSGHYIAYAKLANLPIDQQQQQDPIHTSSNNNNNCDKERNDTMGNYGNIKNDESSVTWMKLDDLNVKNRVEHVESDQVFDQISKHGYLFFYELTRVCDHCIQENLKRSSFITTDSLYQEQSPASIKSSISTPSSTSYIQKDDHVMDSIISTADNNNNSNSNNSIVTDDKPPILSTANTEKSMKNSEKCNVM